MKYAFIIGFLFVSVISCSTSPVREKFVSSETPIRLYQSICSVGNEVQSVQGSIWLKTRSPEVSGQFFADVLVPKPTELKLEVTNLFGGVEASVEVIDDHYEMIRGGKKESKESGYSDSWGGLPLKWASTLFLGRIPCPPLSDQTELIRGEEGELIVRIPEAGSIPEQIFTYWLTHIQTKPWPAYLTWMRKSNHPSQVEIKFEDPEEDSLSPRKWEATSADGFLKMRWRSRTVQWAPLKVMNQKNKVSPREED